MSSADAGWLHMEEPHNLMMIAALLEFSQTIPRQALLELCRQRLLIHPRFAMRVDASGIRPHWRSCAVNMDYHLRQEYLVSHSDLSDWIDLLVSSSLDRKQPLWQFHLFHLDGKSFLLARAHHALGDGVALMRVLLNLADDPPQAPLRPPGPRPGLGTWLRAGKRLLRLILSRPDPPTPLKGPRGSRKRARCSRPLPLAQVKERSLTEGLSLNDLFMLYLSQALADYLAERGASASALDIHAVLPVDLRRQEDEALGNRFGLVFLSLPVGTDQGRRGPAILKERLDELKSSPEAAVVFWLIRLLGVLPGWLNHVLLSFFGSKATLVATNLPGPRQTLHFAGRRLEKMAYWVPTTGRLGLGISLLSYAGHLQVGIISDTGLVEDPERLIELFESYWL